ncbi:MAG: hypothetical protein JXA92_04275, partial [candidate division Zixibacteria bacterium]|nr:hypothetical protein [candidate division Zixibacteria bacterium]
MMKKLSRFPLSFFIVYFLFLLIYLLASYFPHLRWWGLDWWAYYPSWVAYILFGIGLIAAAGLIWSQKRKVGWLTVTDEEAAPSGKYLWTSLTVLIITGLLFYLLRVRTHFL